MSYRQDDWIVDLDIKEKLEHKLKKKNRRTTEDNYSKKRKVRVEDW